MNVLFSEIGCGMKGSEKQSERTGVLLMRRAERCSLDEASISSPIPRPP